MRPKEVVSAGVRPGDLGKAGSAKGLLKHVVEATLAVAAMALAAGCNGAPIYNAGSQHVARGSISDRREWRTEGSAQPPANAIDGNINTAAVASPATPAAQITVDLSRPCLFNMVALDHGRDDRAFAGRVELLTSMDGTNFTSRLEVGGTRRVTTLLLVTPVLARYMRLRVSAAGQHGWSIAEIHIQ